MMPLVKKASTSHFSQIKFKQAYLEINCAHCHSPKGGVRNTRLYLQTELDPKSNSYGYCK
jgi:hypothetical protein